MLCVEFRTIKRALDLVLLITPDLAEINGEMDGLVAQWIRMVDILTVALSSHEQLREDPTTYHLFHCESQWRQVKHACIQYADTVSLVSRSHIM